MRRPNHASRFEGIAKTKLQASRASDTETLQSQVNKAAKKRLSLSGLEILHGRPGCKKPFSLPGFTPFSGTIRSVPSPYASRLCAHSYGDFDDVLLSAPAPERGDCAQRYERPPVH